MSPPEFTLAGAAPSAEPPVPRPSPPAGRAGALALLLIGPLLVNGISLMLALLVYLRAATQCPPSQLLWLGFSYYLLYACMSYFASRKVPPAYAAWALRGALAALFGLSLLIPRVDGFAGYLVLSALNGGVIGFYFAPLQIAMRGIKPCRTMAWTIAFYNVSWGLGAAVGPFVSGWLQPLLAQPDGGVGLRPETWVTMGVAAAIGLHGVLDWRVLPAARGAANLAKTMPMPAAAAVVAAAGPAGPGANLPTPTQALPATGFVSTPTLRQIGFCGAATVTLLRTGLLTTLWPALCAQDHLSVAEKSWGLLLLGVPVPALAPLWAAVHRWFHRPWLSLVLLTLLIPAVGLAPWAGTAGWLAIMGMVGVAVSGLIYLALFYANTDARWPSNSVGLTEAFIGGGGLLGPMLLGSLAGSDARAPLPYLVGAGLVGVTLVGVVYLAQAGARANCGAAANPPPPPARQGG